MQSPKTLTVEIAKQFLQSPENVSLQEYDRIDDAAAVVLTTYNSSLYLDGLTCLSCSAANTLTQHKGGHLSLNGITSLSGMTVGALGALIKYDGVLMLGGIKTLSEEVVGFLSMHKGPWYLERLILIPDRPVDLTTLRDPPPTTAQKDGQAAKVTPIELASNYASGIDEFVLPPLDLLEQPPEPAARPIIDDLIISAKVLKDTICEYGIEVVSGDITKGPTVTLFELHPVPGVRLEKIAALSNNIAMAVRADKVRILAPIPGKVTLGVEVPNISRTSVYLRDMLESNEWLNHKGGIPIMLGRDVKDRPIIGDLATMPHLLIAGESGSGKSVCVNAILASLLYRHSPNDLRLILIDPKMVEMQHYKALPHLLTPIITEPMKVLRALWWVIREMENRFLLFARTGVRNISSFNTRANKQIVPDKIEVVIPENLPYIVVIVDELADLMETVGKDVEMTVARLTALGRAAGIHLVVATQRPSVNVVTGVIKANIPARIAFHVASMQDSRAILDSPGAEKLFDRSDMLYESGCGKTVRMQGVLVLEKEIKDIVDFISTKAKPNYDPELEQKLKCGAGLTGAVDGNLD